jgi:hypothetical protein
LGDEKESQDNLPGNNHGFFKLTGDFRGQLIVDETGLGKGIPLFSRLITLTSIDLVQDAQQT